MKLSRINLPVWSVSAPNIALVFDSHHTGYYHRPLHRLLSDDHVVRNIFYNYHLRMGTAPMYCPGYCRAGDFPGGMEGAPVLQGKTGNGD